jgi:C1A family cysteine protease
MPPVVNQGSEGSCVAIAVAYARSAEEYYGKGAGFYDPSVNIFSPEDLFNQITTSTRCSGAGLITAMEFLKTNGIDTWASMPYSWTNGCSLMPSGAQTQEASQYRISSYSQIPAADTNAIKAALAANHPLTLNIAIDNVFYNAGPGFVWTTNGPVIGYHAMTVVGYDDSRHAWKFMNSFGTSWGDAGYSWVDYDLLPKVGSALMKINL